MRSLRLLGLFALSGVVGAAVLSQPAGAVGRTTDLAVIRALAAEAYVWGLGPQFIERFSTYNTIIGAPFNQFKYGGVPAAWNNEAANAGDASVLYISGFVNFDEAPELVLTVPPSRDQYYVIQYVDGYNNNVGSIGTRTTPSDEMTSYLLVGPNSRYAKEPTARIRGYEYPVMASDTNVNWFLIRILANTLVPWSDPTSVPNVANNVQHKFALNSLQEFQRNGHQPVYPASFFTPPPTDEQSAEAAPYANTPTEAVDFFTQLGDAVVTNPVPKRNTGLSGTRLTDLPSWVVPQYGAEDTYVVPSSGQERILRSFRPLGLTAKGFDVPSNWGSEQLDALQDGYEQGQKALLDAYNSGGTNPNTNYWGIFNDPVGTYPNNELGYLFRSLIVVAGGTANIGLDAIYPTLRVTPDPLDGHTELLRGDDTYTLTFTPPPSNPPLPVVGSYPPMVSDSSSGNPEGFWSIHVYAVDPSQASAPFIAQTSVLNTNYSTTDRPVISVDADNDYMTVSDPMWGPLVKNTAILFGEAATAYGLEPNTVYFVATDPTSNADQTTYTFQISTQWHQMLSDGDIHGQVPIQGHGGSPGLPVVDLLSPSGADALSYGMVQPVTQLGSSQLAADQLALNDDGSLTLWFGPSLPADAPASNWIPTPSTAYYSTVYPDTRISTIFQLTLRMYYPTPGDQPPSILPCPAGVCGTALHQSWIPPLPLKSVD